MPSTRTKLYLKWDGIDNGFEMNQLLGHSTDAGGEGYILEFWDGWKSAIKTLITEDCKPKTVLEDGMWILKGHTIPNKTLQKRLPKTIKMLFRKDKQKHGKILYDTSDIVKSYINFVELHREKEEKGLNPKIYII